MQGGNKMLAKNSNEIKLQWTRMDIERYPNLFRFIVSKMEKQK